VAASFASGSNRPKVVIEARGEDIRRNALASGSTRPVAKKEAGFPRHKPNITWTKDCGKEPDRSKTDYPWFWGWDESTEDFAGGPTFAGNRWNACHYTTQVKQRHGRAIERTSHDQASLCGQLQVSGEL
jgi:hypothetical protein